MKIKSLLVVILLSLFAIALEAELAGYGHEEIALVQEQTLEKLEYSDDIDDDDRLLFHENIDMARHYVHLMKIDFQNRFKEDDLTLEIHKPPIV